VAAEEPTSPKRCRRCWSADRSIGGQQGYHHILVVARARWWAWGRTAVQLCSAVGSLRASGNRFDLAIFLANGDDVTSSSFPRYSHISGISPGRRRLSSPGKLWSKNRALAGCALIVDTC